LLGILVPVTELLDLGTIFPLEFASDFVSLEVLLLDALRQKHVEGLVALLRFVGRASVFVFAVTFFVLKSFLPVLFQNQ